MFNRLVLCFYKDNTRHIEEEYEVLVTIFLYKQETHLRLQWHLLFLHQEALLLHHLMNTGGFELN